MAFITSREMFERALNEDFAVGAFNINNMEIIQGVVRAAQLEQAPLILQVAGKAREYAGPAYLKKMVEAAMDETGMDIVLHLDHGETFELCKQCVDEGYTSVMIDGSKHPFEENVALTKRVVEYAHDRGAVVEAELGKLAGVEDDIRVDDRSATFTDPDQAVEFVERTGVDSLAIAIGTSHGAYKFKGEPYLDFQRLQTIHRLIPNTPLVLHGASSVLQECLDKCNAYGGEIPGAKGVPEAMIRQAAASGICKVNVDTDLKLAMTAEVRQYIAEHSEDFDPRSYLGRGREAIQFIVQHKLKYMLNATGKR